MSLLCSHSGVLAVRVVERKNLGVAAAFATATAAKLATRKSRSFVLASTSATSTLNKRCKSRGYASAATALATASSNASFRSSRSYAPLPTSESTTLDRIPYPKPRPRADGEALASHLNTLFPPLTFPPDVAAQILTHISAPEAWAGHCARLGFIGRRVLQSYLFLFLHDALAQMASSSGNGNSPSFDFDNIAYRTLFTPLLGEHVGNSWDLGRIMLWKAPVPGQLHTVEENDVDERDEGDEGSERLRGRAANLKSPGLYKVQGTVVEGIMGGIFHQHGGTVALRAFHTRVLPHLLLPGSSLGLHDAFHGMARKYLADMGGPDAPLTVDGKSSGSPR